MLRLVVASLCLTFCAITCYAAEKKEDKGGFAETIKIWKVIESRGETYEKELKTSFASTQENHVLSDPVAEFCSVQRKDGRLLQCDASGLSFLVNPTTRLYFNDQQEIVAAKVAKEGTIAKYGVACEGSPDILNMTDGDARLIVALDRSDKKKTKFMTISGEGLDLFSSEKALAFITDAYLLDYEPDGMRVDTFCKRMLLDWPFREEIEKKWIKFNALSTVPDVDPVQEIIEGKDTPDKGIPPVPDALPGGEGPAVSFEKTSVSVQDYLLTKLKELWQTEKKHIDGTPQDSVELELLYTQKGVLVYSRVAREGLNPKFATEVLAMVRRHLRKLALEIQDENRLFLDVNLDILQPSV